MHGTVTWVLACWGVVGLIRNSPQHRCSMFIAPLSEDPPTKSHRCGMNTAGELVCGKPGKGPQEQSVGRAGSSIPVLWEGGLIASVHGDSK